MFDDRLSLRKLEVFLAFLRTENIAKTAEDLGTAAVSVHRALHTLEETIQCPLFTRKGRQLQPLPTAREFAKYAQDLIARMHEAVEETRRVGGFEQKRMRLGSLYSLSVRTVPNLILGMKYRRPELEFELVKGSNKSLLAKLEENKLDAIVIATSGEEIDERKNIVIKLFDDDLFLAAPSDYKGRKKDADLKDLHFAKWVTLQEGFATFDGFVDAFRQTGKTPEIVAKVNDIFSMVSFVQAGLGFALLPGRMQPVFESTVKLITLAEPYRIRQTVGIVFKKTHEHEANFLALAAEARMYGRSRSGTPLPLPLPH